ncbi:hypothetical protein U3516DRAFT_769809 [Neocallimastix sp. 'constans']
MMHLKIASKCGYQVFITRTYVKELNKQRTYDVLFEEIKKNTENNNNIIITPKNFHCDFEKVDSLFDDDYKMRKTNEINTLIKYYKKYGNSIKKKKKEEEMSLLYYDINV